MDLKTLTTEKLKVLAYDYLAQLGNLQKGLEMINQEINSRTSVTTSSEKPPEKPSKVEEKKK